MNETTISILYMVGLFALLWFILIRPHQQRQKKHAQMVASLKVNDRIVTAGGIYGTILKIKEDSIIVRIAENVRIELMRNAVSQLITSSDDDDNDKD
ncbi:preprotein translocase subunit YajC [Sporotomaculum syntrophicum]|uniref:Preprotein translocase subunit YajC n=1 Tax=Sporotomaculum syntrophicum TaxID=182264 RepID=A0A9D3AY87_9FIRM|nr:preprotein translocase subunit YajC [Sporotomaculum syntrophicum]KAF1084524.1 preprotein translocase subunit YajC [Sporotomaculum syntrophicum]